MNTTWATSGNMTSDSNRSCPAIRAGDCPPEDCGGPWGYMDLLAQRFSLLAMLQLQDDQAMIAQRLLDWYDGGPRPTYDDSEFMDALERLRDWLADAPIPFNRRAVNVALRA